MMKKRYLKWKCTICNHIEVSIVKPEECKECKSQGYKIKQLTYTVRRKSHADEPESED